MTKEAKARRAEVEKYQLAMREKVAMFRISTKAVEEGLTKAFNLSISIHFDQGIRGKSGSAAKIRGGEKLGEFRQRLTKVTFPHTHCPHKIDDR